MRVEVVRWRRRIFRELITTLPTPEVIGSKLDTYGEFIALHELEMNLIASLPMITTDKNVNNDVVQIQRRS